MTPQEEQAAMQAYVRQQLAAKGQLMLGAGPSFVLNAFQGRQGGAPMQGEPQQGPLYQPYLTPQEPQQGPLYQPYLVPR